MLWNQSHIFSELFLTQAQFDRAQIILDVRSANIFTRHDRIGYAAIGLRAVADQSEYPNQILDEWVPLMHDEDPRPTGLVRVTITVLRPGDAAAALLMAPGSASGTDRISGGSVNMPESAPPEVLPPVYDVTCNVVRGEFLARPGERYGSSGTGGDMNAFVVLRFGATAVATRPVWHSSSPPFQTSLRLPVFDVGHSDRISIELWHSLGGFGSDQLIASHVVSLTDISREARPPHWVNLYGPPLDTGTTAGNTFGELLNPFHDPGVPLASAFLGRLLIGLSARRASTASIKVEPLRPVPPSPETVVSILPLRVLRVEGIDPGLFGSLSVEVTFGPLRHVTAYAPPAERNRHGSPVVWFTQPLTKMQQQARAESLDKIRKRMMAVRIGFRTDDASQAAAAAAGASTLPGAEGKAFIREGATEREVEAVRKKLILRDIHDTLVGGLLFGADGEVRDFPVSLEKQLSKYFSAKTLNKLKRIVRKQKHLKVRGVMLLDPSTRQALKKIVDDAEEPTDDFGPTIVPIPPSEADQDVMGPEFGARASSAILSASDTAAAAAASGPVDWRAGAEADRELAARIKRSEDAENAEDPYDALPDHTLITRDLTPMLLGANDDAGVGDKGDGMAEASAARALAAAGGQSFIQDQVPDVLVNVYAHSFPHGRRHVGFARIPARDICRPVDENPSTAPRILPLWVDLHRPVRPSRDRQIRAWRARLQAAASQHAVANAASESGSARQGSGSAGAGAEAVSFDDALAEASDDIVGRIELQIAIVQKTSITTTSGAVALPSMPRPTQIDPATEAHRIMVSTLLTQEIKHVQESFAADGKSEERIKAALRSPTLDADVGIADGLPDPRFEWDPRAVLDSQFQELAVVVYQARGLPVQPRVIAERFATPISAAEAKRAARQFRKRQRGAGAAAAAGGDGAEAGAPRSAAEELQRMVALKGGMFVEVLSDHTRPVRTQAEPSIGPSPVWYSSFLLPVFIPTEAVSGLLLRILRRVRRLVLEERRLRQQLDVSESELRLAVKSRQADEARALSKLAKAVVASNSEKARAAKPGGAAAGASAAGASAAGSQGGAKDDAALGAGAAHSGLADDAAVGDPVPRSAPRPPLVIRLGDASGKGGKHGLGGIGDPEEESKGEDPGPPGDLSARLRSPGPGSKSAASSGGRSKGVRFADAPEVAESHQQSEDHEAELRGLEALIGAVGGSVSRSLRSDVETGASGAASHVSEDEATKAAKAQAAAFTRGEELEAAREKLLRARVDRLKSRLHSVSIRRAALDQGLTDMQAHRLVPLPAGIRLRVVMGSTDAVDSDDIRVVAEVRSSDVILSSKPRWAPLTATTAHGVPVQSVRRMAQPHAGELLCWLTYDWRVTRQWHDAQALLVDAVAASSRPGTLYSPMPSWKSTEGTNPDDIRKATFVRLLGHAQRRGVLRQSTALRLARQAQPWLPMLRPYRLDISALGLRSLLVHSRVNHSTINDADAPRYRIVIELPDLAAATLGNGAWIKAQVDPAEWIKAGAQPLDQVPCFGQSDGLGGRSSSIPQAKGKGKHGAAGPGAEGDSQTSGGSSSVAQTTGQGSADQLASPKPSSEDSDRVDITKPAAVASAASAAAAAAADEDPFQAERELVAREAAEQERDYYFAESTDTEDEAMDPVFDTEDELPPEEDTEGDRAAEQAALNAAEQARREREEAARRVEERLRQWMAEHDKPEEEPEPEPEPVVKGSRRTGLLERWEAVSRRRELLYEAAKREVRGLAGSIVLPQIEPARPGRASAPPSGSGVTMPVYICAPSVLHDVSPIPRRVRTFAVEGSVTIPRTEQLSKGSRGAKGAAAGGDDDDDDDFEEEEEEEDDGDDGGAAGAAGLEGHDLDTDPSLGGGPAVGASKQPARKSKAGANPDKTAEELADAKKTADDTGAGATAGSQPEEFDGDDIEPERANLMRSSPQFNLHLSVGSGVVPNVALLRFVRGIQGVPLLCGPRLALAEALWGLGLVRRPRIGVSVLKDLDPAAAAATRAASRRTSDLPAVPKLDEGTLREVIDPLEHHTLRIGPLRLAEEDEFDAAATMKRQAEAVSARHEATKKTAHQRAAEMEAVAWAAKRMLSQALADAEPVWLPATPGYCPDATVYVYREYVPEKVGVSTSAPDSVIAANEEEPGAALTGLQAFVTEDSPAPEHVRFVAQSEQRAAASEAGARTPSIKAGDKRSWVLVGLTMLPMAPVVEAQAGDVSSADEPGTDGAGGASAGASAAGVGGGAAAASAAGAGGSDSGLGGVVTASATDRKEGVNLAVEPPAPIVPSRKPPVLDFSEHAPELATPRTARRGKKHAEAVKTFGELAGGTAVDSGWTATKAVAVAMRSSLAANAAVAVGRRLPAGGIGPGADDQFDEDFVVQAAGPGDAEAATSVAAAAAGGVSAGIPGGAVLVPTPPALPPGPFDIDDVDDAVPMTTPNAQSRVSKALGDVRQVLGRKAGSALKADDVPVQSSVNVPLPPGLPASADGEGGHPTPGPDEIENLNVTYASELLGGQRLAVRATGSRSLGLPIGEAVTPAAVWRWLEDRPSVPYLWSDAVERLLAQRTLQAAADQLVKLESTGGSSAADVEALRKDLDAIEAGKYSDIVDDVLFTQPTATHAEDALEEHRMDQGDNGAAAAAGERIRRERVVDSEMAAAGLGSSVQRQQARQMASVAANISPEAGAGPGSIAETADEGAGSSGGQGWDLVRLLRTYRLRTQDGGDGTRHEVKLRAEFEDLAWLNPPLAALLWVGITRSRLSPEDKARALAIVAARGQDTTGADKGLDAPAVGRIRVRGVPDARTLHNRLQAQLPWFRVDTTQAVYDRYARSLERVRWMQDGYTVMRLWMPSVPSVWAIADQLVRGSAMLAPASILSYNAASAALLQDRVSSLRARIKARKTAGRDGKSAAAAARDGRLAEEGGDPEVVTSEEFRASTAATGAGGIIVAPFSSEGELDPNVSMRWATMGEFHSRLMLSPSSDLQRPLDVLEDTLYDLDSAPVVAAMLDAVDAHVRRTVSLAATALQGAHRTSAEVEQQQLAGSTSAASAMTLSTDDGNTIPAKYGLELAVGAAAAESKSHFAALVRRGEQFQRAEAMVRAAIELAEDSVGHVLVVERLQDRAKRASQAAMRARKAEVLARKRSADAKHRAGLVLDAALATEERAGIDLELAERDAADCARRARNVLGRLAASVGAKQAMEAFPPVDASGSTATARARSMAVWVTQCVDAAIENLSKNTLVVRSPTGPVEPLSAAAKELQVVGSASAKARALPDAYDASHPLDIWLPGNEARVGKLLARAPWLLSAVQAGGTRPLSITKPLPQFKPPPFDCMAPVDPLALVRSVMVPPMALHATAAYQHVHVQVLVQRGDGITAENGSSTRPYIRARILGPGRGERDGHFIAYQSVGGAGSLRLTANPSFGVALSLEAWIPGRCELVVDVMRPAAGGIATGVERGVVLGSTHIDLERRWRCLPWRQMLASRHAPMETRQLLPPGAARDAMFTNEEDAMIRRAELLADKAADVSAVGKGTDFLPRDGASTDATSIVLGPHARAKQAVSSGVAAPLSRGSITMAVSLTPWGEMIRAHPLIQALSDGHQKFELRVVVWSIRQRGRSQRVPVYVTGEVLQPAAEEVEESVWDWMPADAFEVAQQTETHPGMVGVGDDKSILELNWRMKFSLSAPVSAAEPFMVAPRLRLRAYEERPFYMPERVLSETVLELGPLIREAAEALTTKAVEKCEVPLKGVPGPYGANGKLVIEATMVPWQDAEITPVGLGREEPNRDPYLRNPVIPDQLPWWRRYWWLIVIAAVAVIAAIAAFSATGSA